MESRSEKGHYGHSGHDCGEQSAGLRDGRRIVGPTSAR
jgi:hypothetical protein